MTANIIVGLLLLFGCFWGFSKGFVKVLSGVGALIIAFVVSRYLTPVLAEKFGLQISQSMGDGFWQQFFMTQSGAGRLIEGVLYLLIFFVTLFIVRFAINFVGDVINSVPLLGFFGKILGAVVGVLWFVILLYICAFWLFPWLKFQNGVDFMNSATLFMPYIASIGDLLFNLIATLPDSDIWQQFLPESTSDELTTVV